MSHRRPVSEEALERSLRVITEEYVALTRIMTEDEYILETTDPRARRVTPHQVLRLVESSGYKEAIMEDTAVRRGFRRMAKILKLQKGEREQGFQETILCARYEARQRACTVESEMKEHKERVRVAKLRVRASEALVEMREMQLLRQIRATEASVFELIAREGSEETDDSDLGEDSLSELVQG